MYRFNCSKYYLLIVLVIAITNRSDAQTPQSTIEVSVKDPRPVAAAVQDLVARYGYVITYEDPRHSYGDDLEDVTSQVRKDLDRHPRGNAPKVIVPMGATLVLHIPSSPTITAQEMSSILGQLMQAQSNSARGGRFRVERTGEVFHVLPTEVRDGNGNWALQASVLDVPISLRAEDRTADGMINAICNAVNAVAHVHIGLSFSVGGISDPLNPRPYHLGADNERARDVLMRALQLLSTNQKLTWVLFYDPSEKDNTYFLTIESVPARTASPDPTVTAVPRISTESALGGTSVAPKK